MVHVQRDIYLRAVRVQSFKPRGLPVELPRDSWCVEWSQSLLQDSFFTLFSVTAKFSCNWHLYDSVW